MRRARLLTATTPRHEAEAKTHQHTENQRRKSIECRHARILSFNGRLHQSSQSVETRARGHPATAHLRFRRVDQELCPGSLRGCLPKKKSSWRQRERRPHHRVHRVRVTGGGPISRSENPFHLPSGATHQKRCGTNRSETRPNRESDASRNLRASVPASAAARRRRD